MLFFEPIPVKSWLGNVISDSELLKRNKLSAKKVLPPNRRRKTFARTFFLVRPAIVRPKHLNNKGDHSYVFVSVIPL